MRSYINKVVLVLDEEEAKWLKDYLNTDYPSVDERPEDLNMRHSLWKALPDKEC